MDTDSYVTFVAIGVVLVLIDGQILYRSGLRYLGGAYQAENARSVMQLVIEDEMSAERANIHPVNE